MFVYTIKDVIGITLVVLFIVVFTICRFIVAVRQSKCKHNGFIQEDQACNAHCVQCGKNLGFIGTWKSKRGL